MTNEQLIRAHEFSCAVSKEIDAMLQNALNRAYARGDSRQADWLHCLSFDATVAQCDAEKRRGFKPNPTPGRWV